jgi:hypothetical protein
VIFDGRNLYDPVLVRSWGLRIWRLGCKGAATAVASIKPRPARYMARSLVPALTSFWMCA